ncbi:lipid kinase, YegS/Rv2252/BmrU family [Butyrivibrio proteoclasticus]|uniref:Lipid kinase, YegS/Rv2252/BmrU family n=1 Tax=Butyrivibrio proteoclasticus TaxID=43305 RepID=A0A1I5R2G8_9FIRM|nr:diacylglycerol kinase family protein [Butyrivibrio proteoclasticus]SFP52713.1 lipid kinase, YegS/Rv2252/BmrU family [Butyrivibrio proteoclasticus]
MYHCIVNPSARSGKGKAIWEKLELKLLEKKIDYTAYMTKGPGDGTILAKKISSTEKSTDNLARKSEPNNYIKIIVLGGDGTLNEVMNGISDFDKVLVGYVPIGSSNDFARDLAYSKNIDTLLDTILDGKVVRKLDLGKLTFNSMTAPMSRLHEKNISKTRIFDVSSGIGFDAAVCEEALSSGTKNFLNRIGLGKLTYGLIAIKQLLKADKIPCEIELDNGQVIHLKRFIFIASMIHHYEGGGFNFAPHADLADGKFDLVYAGDMPPLRMIFALPLSFFGKHYWIKGIGHHVVKEVTIKPLLPMWVHTDGEVSVKSDNITLECLQEKLQLMC